MGEAAREEAERPAEEPAETNKVQFGICDLAKQNEGAEVELDAESKEKLRRELESAFETTEPSASAIEESNQ